MPSTREDATATSADALASLGLSDARCAELNEYLQLIANAEEAPYEAMDAMTSISSIDLSSSGDSSRIYLMGGGILDSLADLICICDEEWVSGTDGDEDETDERGPVAALSGECRSALDLCSRALNTLGSLCTFAPFRQSILEEDCCEDPLDEETVRTLAAHINRGADPNLFHPRTFSGGLPLLHYPLLCAVLFWARTDRLKSCRAQAVFALSWLLTEPMVASMLVPAGLIEIVFRLLSDQLGDSTASGSAIDDEVGGEAASERVSVTAENTRLYSCICMQRLSRSLLPLFSDQPPAIADTRLQILVRMITSVHSFNIRAILLHVLLQAVTPLPSDDSLVSASADVRTDLNLPLTSATITALTHFRATCGAIGSSQSSRRTSPALDARPMPARYIPPMSSSMHGPPASESRARTSSISSSARRPSSSFSSTTGPRAAPTPSAADDAEDDVGELLRDPEQAIDKTAQLEQLVDAILDATHARQRQAGAEEKSAGEGTNE